MATSLIRRNGVGTLNPWRVMEEMERQFWGDVNSPLSLGSLNTMFGQGRSWTPPADVYETPNDVLVAASLPGIDAANVTVEVHNGTLTISGEQKPLLPNFEGGVNSENGENRRPEVKQHYVGIPRYGRFSFTFALPVEVESERAEAAYQDGILRIRFPKHQSAKPVRVNVAVQNSTPALQSAPAEEHAQVEQVEEAQSRSRKKTA